MTILQRCSNFIFDVILNGMVIYGVVLVGASIFYYFSPSSLYFNYSSVEPVTTPIEIGSDYILMESTLEVRVDGNLYWNDVLRCIDQNMRFTYFSQQDTSSQVVYSGPERTSQWYYRGEIPEYSTTCQIRSVIRRKLPFGIEKQQVLNSSYFQVK